MTIVVDSSYCVVRIEIECEDTEKNTRMTIDIKNEMSLTKDECKQEEA